jgi:hypothetical protein
MKVAAVFLFGFSWGIPGLDQRQPLMAFRFDRTGVGGE